MIGDLQFIFGSNEPAREAWPKGDAMVEPAVWRQHEADELRGHVATLGEIEGRVGDLSRQAEALASRHPDAREYSRRIDLLEQELGLLKGGVARLATRALDEVATEGTWEDAA